MNVPRPSLTDRVGAHGPPQGSDRHRLPATPQIHCPEAAMRWRCRLECWLTSVGMVVAAGALLSLASVGVAVVGPYDFMRLWASLSVTLTPMVSHIDRWLRPLFWVAR